MTKRDEFLKEYREYREYQEALQGAEKRKPEGSWYKVPADDGSEEARLVYDPAADGLEFALAGNTVTIPGKYLKAFQAALNTLMGNNR
jgi:hypothetical protein